MWQISQHNKEISTFAKIVENRGDFHAYLEICKDNHANLTTSCVFFVFYLGLSPRESQGLDPTPVIDSVIHSPLTKQGYNRLIPY